MQIVERYATAIRSSCLTVDERTSASDTDVLASMGLADRFLTAGKNLRGEPIPKAPMAVALLRLFMGDNHAAGEVVEILSGEAWYQARKIGVKLSRVQAKDMARACLAWHRDGRCKSCGGHGVKVMPGTKTLGSQSCKPCSGQGTVPFEKTFHHEHRELARWMVAAMEIEQSKAGPEAIKVLSTRLEL